MLRSERCDMQGLRGGDGGLAVLPAAQGDFRLLARDREIVSQAVVELKGYAVTTGS